MSCLAIGDSIAVGIASAALSCHPVAQKGVPSDWAVRHARGRQADIVIVSAGSNDPLNPNLAANLAQLRREVRAGRVVWIAPRHPGAAQTVRRVARLHGDPTVSLAAQASDDGIHPRSYRTLVRRVMGAVIAAGRR